MILHRQPNSTTFTSVKPARIGSITYSIPTITFDPDPVTKLKLAPEMWRELGCPDALSITPFEPEPEPEPETIVAAGGWMSPLEH